MGYRTAVCCICQQAKRLSQFAPSELSNDKSSGRCRACNRERRLRYKEQSIAKLRAWESAHPHETRERRRLWKLAYPERVKAMAKRRAAAIKKNGGAHTDDDWAALVARYDHRCLGCGAAFTADNPATKDHVIPVTRGGRDDIANLQPLCGLCNSCKGNRTYDYRYDVTEKEAAK